MLGSTQAGRSCFPAANPATKNLRLVFPKDDEGVKNMHRHNADPLVQKEHKTLVLQKGQGSLLHQSTRLPTSAHQKLDAGSVRL